MFSPGRNIECCIIYNSTVQAHCCVEDENKFLFLSTRHSIQEAVDRMFWPESLLLSLGLYFLGLCEAENEKASLEKNIDVPQRQPCNSNCTH